MINAIVADRFDEALKEAQACDEAIAGKQRHALQNADGSFPALFGVSWRGPGRADTHARRCRAPSKKPLVCAACPIAAALWRAARFVRPTTRPLYSDSGRLVRSCWASPTHPSCACGKSPTTKCTAAPIIRATPIEQWEASDKKKKLSAARLCSSNSAGSSGGEAAAVAALCCPMGVGSDIGGSIRMPAFFNGVVGHKPTGGLVSNWGNFPISGGDALLYMTTGPSKITVQRLYVTAEQFVDTRAMWALCCD